MWRYVVFWIKSLVNRVSGGSVRTYSCDSVWRPERKGCRSGSGGYVGRESLVKRFSKVVRRSFGVDLEVVICALSPWWKGYRGGKPLPHFLKRESNWHIALCSHVVSGRDWICGMSWVKRVSKQLAIISMTDILQQVPGEKGLEGDATLPCFKLFNLE